MIHRAPFGSMERFMGILIEHFAGAFPLWLAPEQVRVVPISDRFAEYGKQIESRLQSAGFRVAGDYRPERMNYKIREAQVEKVPYMVVVGEKEQAAGTVTVRDRLDGDIGSMAIEALIERLGDEVKARKIREVVTATASMDDGGKRFEG